MKLHYSPEQIAFNQKVWIGALRSGRYEQGRRVLRTGDDKFCCLGVACDLFGDWADKPVHVENRAGTRYACVGPHDDQYTAMPPQNVMNAVGLTHYGMDRLMEMNDTFQQSFSSIARELEIYPDKFFNK